eukprot:Gb_33748 [translate_table: standard]
MLSLDPPSMLQTLLCLPLQKQPSSQQVLGNGQFEIHQRGHMHASSVVSTMRIPPLPWLANHKGGCPKAVQFH